MQLYRQNFIAQENLDKNLRNLTLLWTWYVCSYCRVKMFLLVYLVEKNSSGCKFPRSVICSTKYFDLNTYVEHISAHFYEGTLNFSKTLHIMSVLFQLRYFKNLHHLSSVTKNSTLPEVQMIPRLKKII